MSEKKTSKVKEFFKGVKGEFKKIVWPSFGSVAKNTAVVVVFCVIIGALVWVLDMLFGGLFNWVISIGK